MNDKQFLIGLYKVALIMEGDPLRNFDLLRLILLDDKGKIQGHNHKWKFTGISR